MISANLEVIWAMSVLSSLLVSEMAGEFEQGPVGFIAGGKGLPNIETGKVGSRVSTRKTTRLTLAKLIEGILTSQKTPTLGKCYE